MTRGSWAPITVDIGEPGIGQVRAGDKAYRMTLLGKRVFGIERVPHRGAIPAQDLGSPIATEIPHESRLAQRAVPDSFLSIREPVRILVPGKFLGIETATVRAIVLNPVLLHRGETRPLRAGTLLVVEVVVVLNRDRYAFATLRLEQRVSTSGPEPRTTMKRPPSQDERRLFSHGSASGGSCGRGLRALALRLPRRFRR